MSETSSTFGSTDIKSSNATLCSDEANTYEINYSDQNVQDYREMNITSGNHRVVIAGKNISTTPQDNATLSTWPAEVQKRIQDKLAAANPPGTWGYFIPNATEAGNTFGPENEFEESGEKGPSDLSCYGQEYDWYATFQIPSSKFLSLGGNLSDLRPDGKPEFLVLQYVEDLGIPKITALKVGTQVSRFGTLISTNIGMCPSEKVVTEDYLKFQSRRDEKDMYGLMYAAGLISQPRDLDGDTVFLPHKAKVKELAARSNSTIQEDYARYHVVAQDVTAAQLKTGQSFPTLLPGAPLSFDSSNASLLVEEVVTKNGRIHTTSDVLTPPEHRQVADASTTTTGSSLLNVTSSAPPPSVSPAAILAPLLLAACLFF